MIDEWQELEAPAKAAKASEPVTIAVVVLRRGPPKVAFSIAESAMVHVGWPRYRVAWNRSRKQFRITGAIDGAFEGFHPPRGPKAAAGSGRRIILRVPMPDDLVPAEGRFAAAHAIDKVAKSLTVTVPSRFWAKKP